MFKKIRDFLNNILATSPTQPQEIRPETPKETWREFLKEVPHDRWLDATFSEGTLKTIDPAPDQQDASNTVLALVVPSLPLPNPDTIISKAIENRAKSIVVVGKDPVPCNHPVPPGIDPPVFSISLWASLLRTAGFWALALDHSEDGVVTILGSRTKDPVQSLLERQKPKIDIDESSARFLCASPHSGWQEQDSIASFNGLATLYLLNRDKEPISVKTEITVKAHETGAILRSHLNFCYVHEFAVPRGLELTVGIPEMLLSPGGHGMQIVSLTGKSVQVQRIVFKAKKYPTSKLCDSASFDQFQRHKIVAQGVEGLAQNESLSVLDVGGGQGLLAAFLPRHKVTILDSRPYDTPSHVLERGENLPFADGSFDVLASMDALEHVPANKRESFIRELWRVSKRAVLLTCPFKSERIFLAESLFANFEKKMRGQDNMFIEEHLANGLPDREATVQIFRNLGAAALESVPNGYLPRWFTMMIFNASLTLNLEHFPMIGKVNQAYNRGYYALDNAEPCYRYLLIVAKRAEDAELLAKIAAAMRTRNASGNPALTSPKSALEFYEIPVSDSLAAWFREHEAEIRLLQQSV